MPRIREEHTIAREPQEAALHHRLESVEIVGSHLINDQKDGEPGCVSSLFRDTQGYRNCQEHMVDHHSQRPNPDLCGERKQGPLYTTLARE